MKIPRQFQLLIVLVPLGVLFFFGITACKLSDFFLWINEKCQQWFMEIYDR